MRSHAFSATLLRAPAESGGWNTGSTDSTSAEGIVSGTVIGTALGWRCVEAIAVGDLVLTFDNGLVPVTRVRRERSGAGLGRVPRHLWPLLVPAGTIGNREALTLLPEQHVMIEADLLEELYGDPFALLPALALEGWRGVEALWPPEGLDPVTLSFAQTHLVYAAGGSLLLCPPTNLGSLTEAEPADAIRRLTLAQARAFVAALKRDDMEGVRRMTSCSGAYAAFASVPNRP
ncbi:MAG: Hint domain-containing protein [Paracoccaceae bacterium]|nr:Hint domain-containing protein [Paracoccaceae bacterium]